jgi:hypothetical protein
LFARAAAGGGKKSESGNGKGGDDSEHGGSEMGFFGFREKNVSPKITGWTGVRSTLIQDMTRPGNGSRARRLLGRGDVGRSGGGGSRGAGAAGSGKEGSGGGKDGEFDEFHVGRFGWIERT